MLQDIKAIIFDMDGSLVDSMWIWKQIDIEYLSQYGYDSSDRAIAEFQANVEGMSFRETAEFMQSHFNLSRSIEEMMDDWNKMAWEKYEKEVFLKPGAIEFLSECKIRGILLGIASSNSKELVDNVMKARELEDFFQVIITGSDGLPGKPAPDMYLEVAKKLGVDPVHCLVFEDIPKGIKAGKDAGMRVCAVEDLYSAHQRNEKKRLADYYIEDYHGIFK